MATARTLIETIAVAHFMANEAQMEQLASQIVLGGLSEETHLRVYLAHMQSVLGRVRRGKQPPQEPVLDAIHAKLYPAFLRGVGPADMDASERNRKGIRARTNASTIRYFIRGGGDVRGLDVATATKSGLRKAVQKTEAPEGASRAERAFINAEGALVRTAQRLARGDPDLGREHIEKLMDELERLLESLNGTPAAADPGQTTTIVSGRASSRGAPAQPAQLHRGA